MRILWDVRPSIFFCGDIVINASYFYIKTGLDSFIRYLIEHLLCARHLGNVSILESQVLMSKSAKRPAGGNYRFVIYFIK